MVRLARSACLSALLLWAGGAGATEPVPGPATGPATGANCSLALAFALDISVSVDDREYQLQRGGLAAALTDPAVARLLARQPGKVAVTIYEWSGRHQQQVLVPWSMIGTESDLAQVAERLLAQARLTPEYPTAIGNAISFGLTALDKGPACARRVLDVSGDGVSNDGYPPASAYRHFPIDGVTVNGLVVAGADPGVIGYYQANVIHGSDAFVEVADSFEDYARAMKRKLLREIDSALLARK